MRAKGKLTTWNDEKGFGFITPTGGGEQVFIHIKAFTDKSHRPEKNQIITYNLSTDNQGRPRAVKASKTGDRAPRLKKIKSRAQPVIIASIFLVFVAALAIAGKLPFIVPVFYLGISGVTFLAYAFDKSAAQRGRWRTKESTLHFMAIVGGWPGALLAKEKIRHKSKKRSFRITFWITVFLNCCLFVWLLTPTGAVLVNGVADGLYRAFR